jgi:hypothetical protein
MRGHNGLIKIAVIKLLFVFIVLNNLVLSNLARNDKLPVPASLCTQDVVDSGVPQRDLCELRTISGILMIETVLVVIPAVLSYRPHGLGLRRSCSLGKVPSFLFLIFFRIFDLRYFWNNKLVKSLASASVYDSKNPSYGSNEIKAAPEQGHA